MTAKDQFDSHDRCGEEEIILSSLAFHNEGTEMEWQAKFQTRVQQRGESVVEYAGELRVLAGRAFPTWSNEQREMLTRNQFIQGYIHPRRSKSS